MTPSGSRATATVAVLFAVAPSLAPEGALPAAVAARQSIHSSCLRSSASVDTHSASLRLRPAARSGSPKLPRTLSGASVAMSSSSATAGDGSPVRCVDAGCNLLDDMYRGTYHGKGKVRHEPDLDLVLRRAFEKGVTKAINLAWMVKESEKLMENDPRDEDGPVEEIGNIPLVFYTAGVHPNRCAEVFAEKAPSASSGGEGESEWSPKTEEQRQEIEQKLTQLASEGRASGNVVAVGECDINYARLRFCLKDIQKIRLRAQLEVARKTDLPLYLHNRDSGDDLYEMLSESQESALWGIVHSFDESVDVACKFLLLGLYIGINGCSLKTDYNLSVVEQLPLDRIVLETDWPWCDMRPFHAGSKYVEITFPTKKDKQYNRDLGNEHCVKNRTEPCHMAQVAAGIKGAEVKEVAEVCDWKNVHDLFGPLKKKSGGR
ncbi:LOW QUALITY PROTEIN: hypothetical protein ACHAWF_016893 [Thalassiosira exigua]